jgi:DNA-directed RNA polymerase specialized sigma24 family protein
MSSDSTNPGGHEPDPGHGFAPEVYEDLRRQASSMLAKRGRTEDPSSLSLVNDVVLNFLHTSGSDGSPPVFESNDQFLRYLTRAMRNHLVSLSRKQLAARRPDQRNRTPWPESELFPATLHSPSLVLDVHLALGELANQNAQVAEIVEMMFFWGCSQAEVARNLERSPDSIRGDWEFGRAWLRRRLKSVKPES